MQDFLLTGELIQRISGRMQFDIEPAGLAPVLALAPTSWNSIFPVQLGPDISGDFALSISGLAIRREDGRYVCKPRHLDKLVDVTAFLLSGIDPMAMLVPVTKLSKGDLIAISADPPTRRYVLEWDRDGELEVLDPDTGDVSEYIPVQDPFFNSFVRIISPFDFIQGLGEIPEADVDKVGREYRKRLDWLRAGGAGGAADMRREGLDIETFLLLSTMMNQQQPANNNMTSLLLLSAVMGRGCALDPALMLLLASGGLQAPGQLTTTAPSTLAPTATAPANNTMAAILALALSRREGGLWRGRHEEDDAHEGEGEEKK